MAEATRIQQETKAFREQVLKWNETKLRREGAERGISGADTIPLVTLGEAIVQDERDARRAASQYDPDLPDGPGADPADHRPR